MKTLILVNALLSGPDTFRVLGHQTADAWAGEKLGSAFPRADWIWLESSSSPVPQERRSGRRIERLDQPHTGGLFTQLEAWASGYELVVFAWADMPFLRTDLLTELLDLHTRYRAEYTFADGYPLGLTVELVNPQILPVLRSWAEKKPAPLARDFLFQLLSTDMNAFDVETLLSPVDLRTARLSLTTDSRRNSLLVERFWDERDQELVHFLEELKTRAPDHRTLPASLLVQITDGSLQAPSYSPLLDFFPQALGQRHFMELQQWEELLDQGLDFCGDLHVFPSLWGEPSLHPQVRDFFFAALERPGITLVVETSGLGWSEALLKEIAEKNPNQRVEWIVELDSQSPESYKKIRGEGFEEAQKTAHLLAELFPGHFWPQTVRMQENEGEMEGFYRYWKEKAGQVILQKFNHYGGLLPQKKVADLSPWNRTPCWHLARDFCVLLDGTVPGCRDDGRAVQKWGNVFQEGFSPIWDRGRALYAHHTAKHYGEFCVNCDEYYTYNF